MPLSEHEQQMLAQMEQALYAEDPKFASHMQGDGHAAAVRRRYIIGGVGTLAGLGLVLLAVNLTNIWIGAGAFALMVAAVAYAVAPPRKRASLGAVREDGTVQHKSRGRKGKSSAASTKKQSRTPQDTPSKPARPSQPSGTFMQRLEERWERRRHDW